MTRAVSGMSVSGAGSRARRRARSMTAFRWAASMTPVRTDTELTPARAPTWVSTSLWIWVRSGQPATVSATSTSTTAVLGDGDTGDHAQLDDVGPQFGVDHPPQRGADLLLGRGMDGWNRQRSEVSGLVTSGILPVGPGRPPALMYRRGQDAGTLCPGSRPAPSASVDR